MEHILKTHQFSGAVVITAASVVQPFLIAEHRSKLTQSHAGNVLELSPRLIHDTCIDVLVEGNKADNGDGGPDQTPEWLPAKLLAVVDVPATSDALLSVIGGRFSFEASWSLAPFNSTQTSELDGFEKEGVNDESRKGIVLEESNNPILLAKSTTRIAFLGISISDNKDGLCLKISQHQNRGDLIVVMGSPFGVLSPLHFYNSISVGNLANCCSSGLDCGPLLVADIRCLPGMEGGPVFDRHASLAGILTKPLRQKGSNAEIQFAVAWNAIASIDTKSLPESQSTQFGEIGRTAYKNNMASSDESTDYESLKYLIRRPVVFSPSSSSLERAISSVVLIAVGEGSWASGIVLNKSGLILTNAHTLEPWRFGRSRLGSIEKALSVTEPGIHRPSRLGSSDNGDGKPFPEFGHHSSRRISIRVDFMERREWYSARAVYVSKGPLDIALLQLESVPPHLLPIIPQFTSQSVGSVVYVVGHGLLGPRSNVSSSVSSGVISNIVLIPGPVLKNGSSKAEARRTSLPVMLQTTAAVHPGASGGAVVNSNSHMIGLVTSNARHGGGTIIPHLNFSIPCSALEPVFKFSETQDISILEILDEPNELLSSVWALVPPKSRNQQPESESRNYREGKSSRFSQFLAEQNADIASLKELNHLKKMNITSKI
ncbi:glyoxysomal processing protease, glyoxysomal isoform X2 [Phalaenopsis equestris]|nr:glyoxysomal processing protease, glyoxysomal isoform X2 [Phalaenopsis equestris]XP_020596591.1 glyoxysomal processing protease, glyoxysomal isoform X2 [Phalaenopsis equestris]